MAALSAQQNLSTASRAGREAFQCTTTAIYAGALVGTSDSTGYLIPWAGGANDKRLAGIALESNNGVAGYVAVNTEGVTLRNVIVAGSALTGVNSLVYCSTDNVLADLTVSATTAKAVGYIARFIGSSRCDVVLFTPTEQLAI